MTQHISIPHKLYLLQLSATTLSIAGRTLEMAMGCYLIETSDGKHILIDSGLPADAHIESPPGIQSVETQSAKNVIEHLADLGLRPDDIDVLICTHFDIDHVGYHDVFTKAKLLVQRSHYELACSGQQRFAAARAHWDHPALKYRLLDGDTELLPGLTLLETSGHTTGHQSVLVRLPQTGPVLLAIDAVIMQHLFTPERPAGPTDENEEQLLASTRKLLDLVKHEHVALVIFGHDGQQWKTLKKAPAYYS